MPHVRLMFRPLITNLDNMSIKVDHTNTKCCRCGSAETTQGFGSPRWYRYYDEKGNWDGISYHCDGCRMKDFNNLRKSITKSRTGELDIFSEKGKGLIGETVIAKVRKLEIICAVLDGFNSMYDLSVDLLYNRIQAKFRMPYYGDWIIEFGIEHNFDVLLILCVSKDMKHVDRTYAISEKELSGKHMLKIVKNKKRWEDFRIDEKPYDDTFCSIMEFLKDRKYFGINDIKKWLTIK